LKSPPSSVKSRPA